MTEIELKRVCTEEAPPWREPDYLANQAEITYTDEEQYHTQHYS